MADLAVQFMALFDGLKRAYGTYDLSDNCRTISTGNKVIGKPKTLQRPVTNILWTDHLKGHNGLGIVPIRDDSTCRFGAIDIDVYSGLNVNKIIHDIDKNGLSLVPCRSKSGGIHCFLFVKEAVPAILMKEKLGSFAAFIGYGKAEIFPKQTEILSDRGDIGQWINMPYYDMDKTERYAYDKNGKKLTAEEFLKLAESLSITRKELEVFKVPEITDISDGPPCLQTILTQGVGSGTRNDTMFNVAVYLKKLNPDNWKKLLEDYNSKYCDPALVSTEIIGIVKSIEKKDYQYACAKSPMKDFCDLAKCRSRKFGVGGLTSLPELTGLTKFDSTPPIWFLDVDGGGRLELTTEEMQNQQKFQRRCMEGLNIMPPTIKNTTWNSMIQKLLETVVLIEVPKDASPQGLFYVYLEQFCTSRVRAREKEEILMGKPWLNDGRHYFRIFDLMSFLERQRFKEFRTNKICSLLSEIAGKAHFHNIKGKGVNLWSVPEFAYQDGEFADIKIEDKEVV